MVILALVAEQWIGYGLVTFFGGFVLADLSRPRKRRSRVQGGRRQ